jgi:hypothetical protein
MLLRTCGSWVLSIVSPTNSRRNRSWQFAAVASFAISSLALPATASAQGDDLGLDWGARPNLVDIERHILFGAESLTEAEEYRLDWAIPSWSPSTLVSVTTFGAKADAQIVRDASIAGNALHLPTAALTQADVGKSFLFPNAGSEGAPLFGTITAISGPNDATVAPSASNWIAAGGTFSWGTDNGPPLQAAVNTVAIGEAAYLPAPKAPAVGYFFSTGVAIPPGKAITGGVGESPLLIVALQQGGPFGPTNVLFSSLPTFGAQFSLAANAAIGQTVVQVTNGDFVKGQQILISEDSFRAASYHVLAADAVDPQNVTLDRPLLQAWTPANFATHWSNMAEDISLAHLTVTGTCLRAVEFEGQNNTVKDVLFSDTVSMVWQTGSSFDTAGYANLYDGVQADGNAEAYRIEGNEQSTIVHGRCRGRNQETGLTGAGILIADSVLCTILDTTVDNYQNGIQLDTGGADPLEKCVDCNLVAVTASDCGAGIFLDQSDGTLIEGATCEGNTTGALLSTNSNTTFVLGSRFRFNPGINGVGLQLNTRASLYADDVEATGNGATGLNLFGSARIRGLKIGGGNGAQSVNIANQGDGSPDPAVEIDGFDVTQDGAASVFVVTAGINALKNGASHQTYGVPFANHINLTNQTLWVDDCSFDGTGSVNWLASAAPATLREREVRTVLPKAIGVGAFDSRGQVVATGDVAEAIPWPDLRAVDRVRLVPTVPPTCGENVQKPVVTLTPGTGFSIVSAPGDTSTYDYIVE